ncbi:MAG: shikimate dehydrogenase [Propylenella sp.]
MTARRAFVVGWPVAHSRSPLIHRFWLKRHGIDGDYRAEAVPPDAIEGFLSSFAEHGYCGGNVTLPHKEAAFRACKVLTPVARQLEAANTLWLEGSTLHGDNTDAYGFAANLDENVKDDWRGGGNALVLGAGGAARAVIFALVEAGYRSVAVLNRTPARAVALAEHFGAPVRAGGLDLIPELLPSADIVVNTTSAGLDGDTSLKIDWREARPDAIATDLVYVPLVTPFLAAAAEHGLNVVDGLGMLLHQAVPGFEHWFGARPTVDPELRALVVADLDK